jgi:hypothetical protein
VWPPCRRGARRDVQEIVHGEEPALVERRGRIARGPAPASGGTDAARGPRGRIAARTSGVAHGASPSAHLAGAPRRCHGSPPHSSPSCCWRSSPTPRPATPPSRRGRADPPSSSCSAGSGCTPTASSGRPPGGRCAASSAGTG